MKESIDQLITKKVEGLKMSSYRKKYLKHPDAEALIKIDIDKNQDDTFDGSINISITWWPKQIYDRERYFNIRELIDNGFAKYSESLGKAE